MEDRNIRIGDITVKDLGKVRLTSCTGSIEVATIRFIDPSHFEMSNTKGEFDAVGSHIWANTAFEIFCDTYGTKLEAVEE
jgi:hypothetical protein